MSHHGYGQAELSRRSIETLTGPIPDCLDPSAFRDARLCANNPHGPGCEWIQSDPGQQSWMLGLPECGSPLMGQRQHVRGLGVPLFAIAGTPLGADPPEPGARVECVPGTKCADETFWYEEGQCLTSFEESGEIGTRCLRPIKRGPVLMAWGLGAAALVGALWWLSKRRR